MSIKSRWSESWSTYHRENVKPNEVVIPHVRLRSNAGWYIGAVEFYNFEEMDFYSRDSDYYPNEELLKTEYPKSISIEEAFYKINNHPLYKRKIERKLS